MGLAKKAWEERFARGYDLIGGGLCLEHIQDPALAGRLVASAVPLPCRICAGTDVDRPVVELDDLMEVVFEAIRYFYREDSGYQEYLTNPSDAADVLESLTDEAFVDAYVGEISEVLLGAMSPDVEWTRWDSDANDADAFEWQWDGYAELAKYQSRIPLQTSDPSSPPSRLHSYLEKVGKYASESLGIVSTMEVGTSLFRGRLCESPREIELTAEKLGPAPRGKAAANRMSSAGVSYFYGSSDPRTAVAEIAGHGVKPLAMIGEFVTTRPLRILDFTAQPTLPSPFDLDRREEAMMGRFIELFVEKITVPVIPDGREHVEYAPTQLLTEYLRWRSQPQIDGIAWPAAGSKRGEMKTNYVLFLGPTDCVTLGTPVAEVDDPNDFIFEYETPVPAALVMDPSRVKVWTVARRVETSEAPPWLQPELNLVPEPE